MCRISLIVVIFTLYSFELIECTRVIADERFLEECLHAHNKYRDLHESTPRLRLNRSATEYALNRVMALAKMENHRMPNDKRVVYGENFYWYYDTAGYHTCQDAVDVWYNGISKYNYNRPGFSDSTGGFSQVVWKSSHSLGCALVEQDKNMNYPETFIVCNYWPAGNIDNQYPFNVYPIKEKERPERPPTAPSSGSSGNEWSGGHRPGSGNRPDIVSGGNKPGGNNQWNGAGSSSTGSDSGMWPIPSRPNTSQRPGGSSHNRPPSPPSYPLIFLHPII